MRRAIPILMLMAALAVAGDPPASQAIRGNYFGYEGRTLHTWEFSPGGTFLHTWIAAGAGTSVRNSERGVFILNGDVLELRLKSAAGGFATPGVGGRSTISGGGAEASSEVRKLKIQIFKSESGIVLDGVKLKPRSW
jgi:hypothetical protein